MLAQYSRLSPRQLRHGLAVLIQQNLVYHHLDEVSNTTFYEANQSAAYNLVRSGKVLEIVGSRYGAAAEDVMQNILVFGSIKVSDLADAYISAQKHVNGNNGIPNGTNGTNGTSDGLIRSAGQLDAVLYKLLEAEFLEPVVPNMFISPSDTYSNMEREVLQVFFGGSTKGVKQKDELKTKVRDRLQALETERKRWRPTGNKRPSTFNTNGVNGINKRRKLSNGIDSINGHHEEDDEDEVLLDVGLWCSKLF